MLKKTITYSDYNGNERTEDFYFNLTKAEVTEMELSVDGGLAQMLENIVNSKDNKEILLFTFNFTGCATQLAEAFCCHPAGT